MGTQKLTASGITGVVLAGGLNRRFDGKSKTNELIGGERIISRILNTIEPLFGEIIIVTNTPGDIKDISGVIIAGDIYRKRGPLGGIHAAMNSSSGKAVFIIAGDMPFTDNLLIKMQIDDFINNPADASVPVVNGNHEPLHALYMNRLEKMIGELLESGSDIAVKDFLDRINVRYFRPGNSPAVRRAFTNINTPGDAAKANK